MSSSKLFGVDIMLGLIVLGVMIYNGVAVYKETAQILIIPFLWYAVGFWVVFRIVGEIVAWVVSKE